MATIVKRKGSVPREVGAKMLVHRGGKISGTVGGGCGEAEVWRSALNVIDTLRPSTVQVDLTEEIAMESQGVCGGIFDVFIQPWHNTLLPGQPGMIEFALTIQQALEGEHAIVLITIVAAGGPWRSLVGQHMLVPDDRASFASRERFPDAKRLLVGDIEETLRKYPITPRTHIVLVTRAHAHDIQGLRVIIDSPAAYIGMIGSQRRVWAVFKLLHEEGVPAEKLGRVRAPIGLDLGGSTPEEIALCIMAEIIKLRHGGTGIAMSEPLCDRYMERLRRVDQEV